MEPPENNNSATETSLVMRRMKEVAQADLRLDLLKMMDKKDLTSQTHEKYLNI